MAGAHTKIVLPEVSVKKRSVVPSAGVDESLDVGPGDGDEAGNVLTRDEVRVNGVPDFLAFLAHGKPLNMHGCVEAALRSVVHLTEVEAARSDCSSDCEYSCAEAVWGASPIPAAQPVALFARLAQEFSCADYGISISVGFL